MGYLATTLSNLLKKITANPINRNAFELTLNLAGRIIQEFHLDVYSMLQTMYLAQLVCLIQTWTTSKFKRNNPRKATGPDCICACVMKDCASELAQILLITIFNKSVQEGTVQYDWRHANAMAIFKQDTRHNDANYRPVSLTSLCCKLSEHVIVSNTVRHLEKHKILNDCLHDLRAKRSCETLILTLYHELVSSLDKKNQTDMIILDFTKAFDHVPL